jgi:hypothetical protein
MGCEYWQHCPRRLYTTPRQLKATCVQKVVMLACAQDTTGDHKGEWQLDPLELVRPVLYRNMPSLVAIALSSRTDDGCGRSSSPSVRRRQSWLSAFLTTMRLHCLHGHLTAFATVMVSSHSTWGD